MSTKGNSLAQTVLEKLLQKAERAWAQRAEREHTLLFSEASLPEYFRLPLRQDKDIAHAELREAERDGAISLEWDRRAGADGQIVRTRLLDPNRVAAILGRTSAWQAYDQALNTLGHWMHLGNVADILVRWRTGKTVRNLTPLNVLDVVDACKVVEACRESTKADDVPIRRLSGQLFADSKRIEAIGAALDIVTAETLEPPWRDIEDVLRGLGLVKLPQPILIAGNGVIKLNDETTLGIPSPYIGLSPASIQRLVLGENATFILTVENLTTFHELALDKAGKPNGLVVYTGGMPSPAMLGVYSRSIKDILAKPGVTRFHWGDIDLGGVRIAARIARTCEAPLLLWNMDPSIYPGYPARKYLADDEVREIKRVSEKFGWQPIASAIASDLRAIEQEVLPPSLPGA
ncbi:Wadjet anti-phage system protein JetD domain-containing protein [Vogesella indigofera]|uniref:Wadjet anti-phage system protein JetD domain-containing protein n=1 Tax=Vogesella indigofera TaxID=45465 RepID=UPI0035ADFDC5